MAFACDYFIKFFDTSLDSFVIDKCSICLKVLTVTQLRFFRHATGEISFSVSRYFRTFGIENFFQAAKVMQTEKTSMNVLAQAGILTGSLS